MNQTYSNIEVIVVDKKSNDRTVALAKDFDARVYVVDASERCKQMNFGVEQARGEFVYIVGSDFALEPTVVEEAVESCIVDRYDALCIHNTSDPDISFWSRVRKLERDCYMDDDLNVGARFFWTRVFKAVCGFDERLVAAEDYDLHNRLLRYGFEIGRIESREIHFGEPRNLLEIAKKHYYYGKTLRKFLYLNRVRGIRQISPIRPAFLRNLREFFRNPLLTFGFVVYQCVRYSSAGLGFLLAEIKG